VLILPFRGTTDSERTRKRVGVVAADVVDIAVRKRSAGCDLDSS